MTTSFYEKKTSTPLVRFTSKANTSMWAHQGRPRLGRGQASEGGQRKVEKVYEQKVVKTPQMPQQQKPLAQFQLFFWMKNSRGLN